MQKNKTNKQNKTEQSKTQRSSHTMEKEGATGALGESSRPLTFHCYGGTMEFNGGRLAHESA